VEAVQRLPRRCRRRSPRDRGRRAARHRRGALDVARVRVASGNVADGDSKAISCAGCWNRLSGPPAWISSLTVICFVWVKCHRD
jgi:hypothetical protein